MRTLRPSRRFGGDISEHVGTITRTTATAAYGGESGMKMMGQNPFVQRV
jgi:hypothetical protein